MDTKTCTRCKHRLPVTSFKDGRRQCNSCLAAGAAYRAAHNKKNRSEESRASDKAYRAANKEKIRELKARWYQKHKKTLSVKYRAYRSANAVKIKKRNAIKRAANKEHDAIKKAAYYKANREAILLRNATYRRNNREKIRAQDAAWKRLDSSKAITAAWRIANRDKLNAQAKARHAKPEYKAKAKAYRHANADRRKATLDAWRASHKEQVSASHKVWTENNRGHVNAHNKTKSRLWREQLNDIYVKTLVSRCYPPLNRSSVPKGMIEAKRMLLKVQRAVKLLTKNNKQKHELQKNSYSIGDLEREIQNADYMRRNQRDASGSNDRPSSQKDRPRRS